MKAVLYERYGPPEVLQIRETEKPTPKDNEVLIRIRATTVTSGDWRARTLIAPKGFGILSRLFFGISKPREPILGTECSGDIEDVGKNVTRFKAGDQVFAFPGAKMGCYAEYVCVRENGPVALKPPNLSYEEAAALSFGGQTMLDFYRKGNLQRGDRVLVNGASGGVGTAAVQLARYFGAEVTGVCSGPNIDLVRSLGATQVIDYTREDFTRNGQTYDVIVDTVGTAPFSRCRNSLREGGRLLLVLAGLPEMLRSPWNSLRSGRKIIAGPASERPEDLQVLGELARNGHFRPVIDRRYPLEQIVEAHRYVDTGRKRGNVVITVE